MVDPNTKSQVSVLEDLKLLLMQHIKSNFNGKVLKTVDIYSHDEYFSISLYPSKADAMNDVVESKMDEIEK